MCSLCVDHFRKVGQFQRALTQPLDGLSTERITLALSEIQERRPTCRETWRAGQRVSRTDASGLGTIIEDGERIKVKWDDGATSYYVSNKTANIRLHVEK